MKYRDNDGLFKDLFVKTSDTLPIGTIVEYDGTEVPTGYEEVKNPNIYSYEEVKTSKIWIDGKPIYRKFIDLGVIGEQYEYEIGNTYSDVIYLNGFLYKTATQKISANQFKNPEFFRSLGYEINGSLKILFDRSNLAQWNDWSLKIIIEYTKTTDEEVS